MFAPLPECGCTFACSARKSFLARSIANCSTVSTFSQPPYQHFRGYDFDQLGAIDVLDEDATLGEIAINTRPTLRFPPQASFRR